MSVIETLAVGQVPVVQDEAWWLTRLEGKLRAKLPVMDRLDRYYRGDHPLPEGDERCRAMFKAFQRKARTNYMRLVADAPRERMRVVGFRTGGDGNADTDRLAWHIWQANRLDMDSGICHETTFKLREAYAIIGPPTDAKPDVPVITIEDPRQVITEHDPVDRRHVRAGLKMWVDYVDGKRHAVLYLPDMIHYFVAEDATVSAFAHNEVIGLTSDSPGALAAASYQPSYVWKVESDPVVNTLGQVPVVRFLCRPTIDGHGVAEFEDVIDIQDRINDTILNRLVVAKLQAYRQRWVKGVETEDEDGNDLDLPFVPGVDLLWAVNGKPDEVEFGEFEQVDLKPFLDAVEADVKAIVTLKGLPPHYVQGDIVNASADTLAAAESRLVAQVRDRSVSVGESWEQVLRISFAYLDRSADFGDDAEVQWADPERKSDAQLADAAIKKKGAGVPWRQRMVDLGYTPPEIDRMDADRANDAMLEASLLPQPAPAPVAGPPVTPTVPNAA